MGYLSRGQSGGEVSCAPDPRVDFWIGSHMKHSVSHDGFLTEICHTAVVSLPDCVTHARAFYLIARYSIMTDSRLGTVGGLQKRLKFWSY